MSQSQRRVYVQTDGGQDIFHTLFACVAHDGTVEAVPLLQAVDRGLGTCNNCAADIDPDRVVATDGGEAQP